MKIKAGTEDEYAKYKGIQTDPYSNRCVVYWEDWANLMEADIAADPNPGDIEGAIKRYAKDASRRADTDGITGFMYGVAVSSLARFWEHGEALRRWHNLDTQIGTEGERANEKGTTLNPALLSIG